MYLNIYLQVHSFTLYSQLHEIYNKITGQLVINKKQYKKYKQLRDCRFTD